MTAEDQREDIDTEAEVERVVGGESGAQGDEGDRASETGEDKSAEVDALMQEIEALTAELEELRDRHLRLAAEFDNFRKRTIRERAEQTERAQAELVKELLEPLDDLTRVTQEGTTTEDVAALREGVQLVERKLRRILERSGLEGIEAVGEPFDPELHEALTTVPTGDPGEDGIVAQELARGYLFNEMLLRPARVQVKKFTQEAASDDPEDGGDAEDDS